MTNKITFQSILEDERALREKVKSFIEENLVNGEYKFKEPVRRCEFDESNGYPRSFFILSIRTNRYGTRMYALKYPVEDDGDYDSDGDMKAVSEQNILTEDLLQVCQEIYEEAL